MTTQSYSYPRRSMSRGGVGSSLFLAICSFLATAAVLSPTAADAGPRGGGFKGFGASGRFSRPSGGFQRPSGMQRPSGIQKRNGKAQPATAQGNRGGNAQTANAKNGNTARSTAISGNSNRSSTNNGNTRETAVNNGRTNTGTVGSGNGNTSYAHDGNTGVVGSGNVNTGNVNTAVNTGNVAVGNDVDVNVNGGAYGYPYYGSGAAYATGVAVGATTSAVAYGTAYASIPASSCSTYVYGSASYYRCGTTWYQMKYQGSSTTYIVVADPTR